MLEQVWCDIPAGGSWCVPLPCIRSLRSFTRTHEYSHMCKCTQTHSHTHTHTHTDLHLLPLCATLVHLIDDAVSLLLSLSNTHTHTHTHTCKRTSYLFLSALLLSVSSKLYPFLHCPLSFIPFPCPVATVQLLAVPCVFVCVCLHMCVCVCVSLS